MRSTQDRPATDFLVRPNSPIIVPWFGQIVPISRCLRRAMLFLSEVHHQYTPWSHSQKGGSQVKGGGVCAPSTRRATQLGKRGKNKAVVGGRGCRHFTESLGEEALCKEGVAALTRGWGAGMAGAGGCCSVWVCVAREGACGKTNMPQTQNPDFFAHELLSVCCEACVSWLPLVSQQTRSGDRDVSQQTATAQTKNPDSFAHELSFFVKLRFGVPPPCDKTRSRLQVAGFQQQRL